MYLEHQLSDLFFHNGIVIYGKKSTSIFDLDVNLVIKLFEKHGIVLFRDFDLDGKSIKKFSNQFTKNYSQDAQRRNSRFGDRNIRNVDYGFEQVDLHSEASFSPSCPEIIWFYCVKPAKKSGKTLLCDGVSLWNSLNLETKNFFLSNQISYKLKIINQPNTFKIIR